MMKPKQSGFRILFITLLLSTNTTVLTNRTSWATPKPSEKESYHGLSTRSQALNASAPISIDEVSNGTTIKVATGQIIELTLHSTYWQINGSSATDVVVQKGEPSAVSSPPGGCPPGVGCGVVRVAFTAKRPGSARISASRRLCGEVLLCKPDQQSFALTIIVH